MSLVNKRFVPKGTVGKWVKFMETRHPGKYTSEDLRKFALGALHEAGVGIGKPMPEKNAKSGRARLKKNIENTFISMMNEKKKRARLKRDARIATKHKTRT